MVYKNISARFKGYKEHTTWFARQDACICCGSGFL